MTFFIKPKERKTWEPIFEIQWLHFRENSFRERNFSLEIHKIQPSTVFSTRGRTALRREGFAWVPDFGSFFKLLEVGVSPYLSFILILNVLLMFRLNEVVRGRLIGPKTWDRIDKICERKMEQPVTAPRLFGLIWVCLHVLIMCWFGKRPGTVVRCGFTK